jgi:hypothetical protein
MRPARTSASHTVNGPHQSDHPLLPSSSPTPGPHRGANTAVCEQPATGWRHDDEKHFREITLASERTNIHRVPEAVLTRYTVDKKVVVRQGMIPLPQY